MLSSRQTAVWDDVKRSQLIEQIRQHLSHGNPSRNGIKKEAWTRITAQFNDALGLSYTKPQLHSQYSSLKARYTAYHALKNQSGFGWSDDNGPLAPPEVWDSYLQHHKNAAEFRNNPLPFYTELHEIFSGSVPTGRFSSNGTARLISMEEDDTDLNETDTGDC